MSGDRRPIMEMTPNRRHFLTALSSAGFAGLISSSHPHAQERPLETTTIRLAKNRIRSIASLKGKTVGVPDLGTSPHVFLSTMAAHVGLDPARDINWITSPGVAPKDLFAAGKIDAFLGFPPEPQELRARGIGRVVVNSSVDRPWSQYFCCMLAGNTDFVRNNPVATKRVLRAILKATDCCASDPAAAARR